MIQFFQNIVQTLISLINIILKSDFSIFALSISKKETPCLILANGPSLNYTLTEIENKTFKGNIYCVNQFSSSEVFGIIKPQYYVLLDPAFADKNHYAANKAIENLISKTNWEMSLLLPSSFKKHDNFLKRISLNENIKIKYFNYSIFRGFEIIKFWFFKKNLGMPQSQNVLLAATYCALIQGYKRIYIAGADHSWHEGYKLNKNGELNYIDSHFYGEKKFDLDYFVNKNESFLAQQFNSLHKVFKGYEIINKFALSLNASIINVSEKSYIDVFEKLKYKDI
jgi:hypothetical protein